MIKCLPGTCKALGVMLSSTHGRRRNRKKSKRRNGKGQRKKKEGGKRKGEEMQEEEEEKQAIQTQQLAPPQAIHTEASQHFCTEIHI